MKSGMAALIFGLAALGMAAPLAAMAGHEQDRDMPSTVITVVCTIYSDQTVADLVSSLSLDGYMPDCEMTVEYVETAQLTASVSVAEGSLYPQCADTDNCFDPHTITVEPGTAVTWTNHDNVVHTITESEPVPAFDGWTFPGEEFTFTFDESGTYMYGCTLHPWASGVVMVGSGSTQDASEETDEPTTAVQEDNPQLAYDYSDYMIELYKENGVGSFEEISSEDPNSTVTGFVIEPDNYTVVAHPNAAYLGFPVEPLLDAAFIPFDTVLEILAVEGAGVWLSYPVPDPTGNIIGYERGWFRVHDEYIFGARYTLSDEERVQSIVEEMIRVYNLDPDGAFDTISSFMSTDPKYPFVVELSTLTVVAHGSNPAKVGGTSVSLTNSTVSPEEFRSLEEGEGVWAEYTFNNPSTGMEQHKRTWMVMHDGYMFGSGFYP